MGIHIEYLLADLVVAAIYIGNPLGIEVSAFTLVASLN